MGFLDGVVSGLKSVKESSSSLSAGLAQQHQGNVVAGLSAIKLAGAVETMGSALKTTLGVIGTIGKSYYNYSDAVKRSIRGTELMGKSLDDQRNAQTRLISSSNKWVRMTGESAERAAAFTTSFERSMRRAFDIDVTEEAMEGYQKNAKVAMRYLNATSTEIQQLQERLIGEMRYSQEDTEKLFAQAGSLTRFGMDSQRMMETLTQHMEVNMQVDQQTRQQMVGKQMEAAVIQYKAAVDFSRSVEKVANPGKERMKQAAILSSLTGESLESTLKVMEGARRGVAEDKRSLQQMLVKASSAVGVDQQAIENYQQNKDPLGYNISAQILDSTLGRYGLGNLADMATYTENEKRLNASGNLDFEAARKDFENSRLDVADESDTLAESFAMMRAQVDMATISISEWIKKIPGAEAAMDLAKQGAGLAGGFNDGMAGGVVTSIIGNIIGHVILSKLGGSAAAKGLMGGIGKAGSGMMSRLGGLFSRGGGAAAAAANTASKAVGAAGTTPKATGLLSKLGPVGSKIGTAAKGGLGAVSRAMPATANTMGKVGKFAGAAGKAAAWLDPVIELGRLGLDSEYRETRHRQADTEDTIWKGLYNRFTIPEEGGLPRALSITGNLYDVMRQARLRDVAQRGARESEQAYNEMLEAKKKREADPQYWANLEKRKARIRELREARALARGDHFDPETGKIFAKTGVPSEISRGMRQQEERAQMMARTNRSMARPQEPFPNRRPLPQMSEYNPNPPEIAGSEQKVSDPRLLSAHEQGTRVIANAIEKLISKVDRDYDDLDFSL